MTRLVLFELFVTNLLLEFENQQQQKLLVSWQFSGPYGVTKYGSGWRKDVVNQCLEFDISTHIDKQSKQHYMCSPLAFERLDISADLDKQSKQHYMCSPLAFERLDISAHLDKQSKQHDVCSPLSLSQIAPPT